MSKNSDKLYPIVVAEWTEDEYEPGWGRSLRPDGYSLHLTKKDFDKFYENYKSNHEAYVKEHPSTDGYSLNSFPSSPQVYDVDKETYDFVKKHKNKFGITINKYDNNIPVFIKSLLKM